LLHSKPQWVVVRGDGDPTTVLPAADLATHLRELQLAEQRPETIDLLQIPAQRRDVIVIDVRANLQEALDALADDPTQVLCVAHSARGRLRVLGIATTHDIEFQYTYRPPLR
jgi:CIC family chloride channel protein